MNRVSVVCKYILLYALHMLLLFVLYSIKLTLRRRCLRFKTIPAQDDAGVKFVFLWHRSLVPCVMEHLPYYLKSSPVYTMLSPNKSTIIARMVLKTIGSRVILGSKYQDSTKSIKGILSAISKHKSKVVITTGIDGPRGPELQISDATLFKIIKKANAGVYFVSVISKNFWQFPTWDSMYIPKPFSPVILVNEVILSRDEIQNLQPEELRKISEARMNEIFNKARAVYNLPPAIPGAVKKKRYE